MFFDEIKNNVVNYLIFVTAVQNKFRFALILDTTDLKPIPLQSAVVIGSVSLIHWLV